MTSHLFYPGDNLPGLRRLADLGIAADLVYIDPPFAANNDFLIDHHRASAVSASGRPACSDRMRGNACLDALRQRLAAIHALLNPAASIYVHIDVKMEHRIRQDMTALMPVPPTTSTLMSKWNTASACCWTTSSAPKTSATWPSGFPKARLFWLDDIFGPENFRNSIARIKCNPKTSPAIPTACGHITIYRSPASVFVVSALLQPSFRRKPESISPSTPHVHPSAPLQPSFRRKPESMPAAPLP